jgi:hypothetical protein
VAGGALAAGGGSSGVSVGGESVPKSMLIVQPASKTISKTALKKFLKEENIVVPPFYLKKDYIP